MIPDQLLRLAINRLSVLRPAERQQLEEIVDTEAFLASLTPHLLSQIIGRQIARMDIPGAELIRAAERDLDILRSRQIFFLSQRDARYPVQLREIFDAPYLLFVRGELPSLSTPIAAVVGTRKPTAAAVIAARELSAELVRAGVPVVSGLALGIDAAAHRGALEGSRFLSNAVPTGAILGSGIDLIAPGSHRSLAAAILEAGGFIASEYSPGVPPLKYHFPARNRIISGMSRAVVVAQAPAKSGALITADYALDQGRDLLVLEAGMHGAEGAGTSDLASDGAPVISCGADLLAEWGRTASPVASSPPESTTVAASSAEAAANRVDSMRAALEEATR